MESKIESIKKLLDTKKEKYPNISNVWLKFINEKINSLDKSLSEAEKVFSDIDNTLQQDLSMNTIAILFLLKQKL
jgi:hypothetical protein